MTTKHTPGPWSRNIRANGKYPIVFAGRNQHVAQACQQKDGAETESNIDLIAAAPDLLTALEEIVAEWSGDGCMADHNDTAGIEWARAALARAKGQA